MNRKIDDEQVIRRQKELNWAIKKPDAEPFLRWDIQYDVLTELFNDRTFQFTAPVDQNAPPANPIYLNFDQLYLEAILSSTKATTHLRARLVDNPAFAVAFMKFSLLLNVGRLNTTVAFYPNMKTALRTYHPVPSLQFDDTTRNEMQDAPRLKGILKGCCLDWEAENMPPDLKTIAQRHMSPMSPAGGPPTTIVSLIFLFFQEANWVSDKYFPPGFGYGVYDIFYPSKISAKRRATTFLMLLHRMLENKEFYNDMFTAPGFVDIQLPTQIDFPDPPTQDVDTPEELEYAAEMKALRSGVVKTIPSFVKRDEEIREKEAKKAEKDLTNDGTSPPKKKRKVEVAKKGGKSERTTGLQEILPPNWQSQDWTISEPMSSALYGAWTEMKRLSANSIDPEYDSDEEGVWDYDYLLRRQRLEVIDQNTGTLIPVNQTRDYLEYIRRRDESELEDDDAIASRAPSVTIPGR